MASDGSIKITTELDSKAAESALSKFSGIAKAGLKGVTTAVTAVSAGLTGLSGYAIKAGADFEAQMSRVQAISGATASEFDQLREQAVELGADTAFSASEAAQGMENLAAAGFETNEIMEAMPGLLDLAAASGEDLAASSDIAASTLRGFGLAASEAGHVADVLAENANRTNSSVADTGEAMKYIAPLARAAGISLEETAAAIGIMANAGIQGGQAGTTLRGALSRLSKPTDDMKEAMNELGISFYDSEGKMLSLADQVGMLESAMSGLTDEQKNNYLVTLYGQESLSGMLALINEGAGSLTSLTSAYESCDGAAQKAADTMQDNLKGAVEELSGSAESLGITFYDKVSGSLKDAAQTATESVNSITDSLNNGGIEAAVKTAGDEFASLATEAANHAPDMVNSAVKFVQSFVSGVYSNRGQILDASVDIASTLASGLADLLPKSVSVPVKAAIDDISQSFEDGGLRSAIGTASDLFEKFGDIAGKVAKVSLPPLTKALDLVSGNLDTFIPLATSAFTVFKGYKTISSTTSALSKAAKAWETAEKAVDAYNVIQMACTAQGVVSNATLTIGQAAVGVLTGKVSLATAAQTAWNAAMSANPIGLVVTAVAALAAGIGAAVLVTDRASESTGKLTDKQKESIEASKEAIKSIEEEAEARQKSIQASTAEIDNAEVLWNELHRIVDANGQVKAGYEARANYITGQLSDALGIEISLTDGVIDNYQELEGSIYDVIAAKKAEAVLDTMKSEYTAAMQEQADAAKALADEYQKLKDIKSEQAQIEADLAEEEDAAIERYSETGQVVKEYSGEYYKLKDRLSEVNGELETQQANFDKANAAMQDNQKVISDYNMLTEAAMSGNTEAINSALAEIQSGLDTTLAVGSAAAIEQANTTASTLTSILQGEADGLYALQNQTKESLAESMGMALNQVGTGAEEMKQVLESAGREGSARIIAAMAQADLAETLSEDAKAGMESFIAGFDGLDEKTKEVWAQAWYGALEGLEGFEELKDPAEEGVDAFLESLRTALEVHSPSQAVKDIFSQVWPGAAEGLAEGQEELNTTGTTVIQSFLSALSSSDLFEGAKNVGSTIMSFFGIGVSSQIENSRAQGRANADAANQGAGSVDPTGTGNTFGGLLGGGIGSMSGTLYGNGKSLGDSANQGAGSVNPTGTGGKFGSRYASGVGNQAGNAETNGESLANSAETGAATGDGYSPGYDFGSGFVNGIGAWLSDAATAAANLAMSAWNALRDALEEHSPSRKTKRSGKNFDLGFAGGVDENADIVEKSVDDLSERAFAAFDTDSLQEKINNIDIAGTIDQIYDAMSDTNARISDRVTANRRTADLSTANKKQEKHATYEDLQALRQEISKLAERPVVAYFILNERVAAKALAKPMQEEMDKNASNIKRLGGKKS